MDRHELESKVLDMLADICADDAALAWRDADLFDAGLLAWFFVASPYGAPAAPVYAEF